MLTLCRLPPQVVDFHDDAAAGPYASSEYPIPPNVATFHFSCLPDQSRAAQALPGIASPGCVSKTREACTVEANANDPQRNIECRLLLISPRLGMEHLASSKEATCSYQGDTTHWQQTVHSECTSSNPLDPRHLPRRCPLAVFVFNKV